ncbi:MAG: biotin/lipoyl-binding protein, partial [Verrucomicrobia bacterium]|nr:biotin/lipoyl-binding protein [Verrucomicrobiota bacterium]
MKNRSHFLFFYSLIIGSLILTGGCGKKTEQSAEYKVGVTLAKPSKLLFQNSIHVQGIIQPVEKAILGAKMDGVLELLAVKEGDTVKKGDLLFQIDKLNLENRFMMSQGEVDLAQKSVEAMSAQLEISKKEMEKAQTDYERAKTLLEQEVISNDSYEKAEVNAHKAAHVVTRDQELLNYMNAQLSVKQTAKMVAEKNLRDSKGIAPFDGVITHKFKEQGEYPGSGFRTP